MTTSIAVPPTQESDHKDCGTSAQVRELLGKPVFRSVVVYVCLLSGLCRVSAFVRDTYVAARFGRSTATDAYYGLQQLPLTVSTFMFGAFALAFAPAYVQGKRGAAAPDWVA